MNANSGNAWTQIVLNAGGTAPQTDWIYGNVGGMPYFPYGSGNPMGTQWFVSSAIQTAQQAVSYASQVISNSAYQASQATLNSISAMLTSISSIINSLKR